MFAYKIANCAVNEVSIDFDIDGIATLNWSGFGKSITEHAADAPSFTKLISEGAGETSNFVRNRLTSMEVTASGLLLSQVRVLVFIIWYLQVEILLFLII